MRERGLFMRLAALVLGIMVLTVAATLWVTHRSVEREFTEASAEASMSQEASATALAALARDLAGDEERMRATARAFAAGLDERPHFLLLDRRLGLVFTNSPLFGTVAARFEGERLSIVGSREGRARSRVELVTDHYLAIRGRSGAIAGYLVSLPPPPGALDGKAFATGAWMQIAAWLLLILVVGMLLAAAVLRRAIRPIDRLTRAALTLNEGRMPAPVEPPGIGELDALFAAFNSAVATIGRTAELRKQMVADVAHELRTPITNLRAQVEAFEAGLVTDREALAATLSNEIGLLERLVEDFQQLALSEAGQLSVVAIPFDLADLAGSLLAARAEQMGFALDNRLVAPLVVSGDPDRVQQVLLNLVENAARHRREGLVIRLDPIARGERRGLRFGDNGPGIAEGANEKIFERFYRGPISREQDAAGAGLGLTIARSLMRAMGGTITAMPPDADADADTGARFELLFRRPGASA